MQMTRLRRLDGEDLYIKYFVDLPDSSCAWLSRFYDIFHNEFDCINDTDLEVERITKQETKCMCDFFVRIPNSLHFI